MEKSISEYLRKRNIPALVEVHLADSIMQGAHALIQAYGFGPLSPNTILLGETEQKEKFFEFSEMIMYANLAKKNLVILREGLLTSQAPVRRRKIDVWWGRERQNAGLMLAFAYMLQTSADWAGATISLKTIVQSSSEKEIATNLLSNFVAKGRVNVNVDVIVNEEKEAVFDLIKRQSMEAQLVFIGMRPPEEGDTVDTYSQYYHSLIEKTEGFPQTAIVIAADNIDFANIFA